jgi:hypothetical protein
MKKRNDRGTRFTVYAAFAILLMVAAAAQGTNSARADASSSAPVPEQLKSAKKVFLGNAGADVKSRDSFAAAGELNQPYNDLYSALKGWGRYELVSKPEDAELVMEVRFTGPMTDCGKVPTYSPSIEMSIFDAKTHFVLWTITEPVQGAYRKDNWKKNVENGAKNIVEELKHLTEERARS